MSGYPAFWLLVAAVVARLLAEIPLGFKGMELDRERIRGRPLVLAAGGWPVSLLLALAVPDSS